MGEISHYPICWPDNVARTRPIDRQEARFDEWSVSQACALLLAEINRLNERPWSYNDENVIISTNLKPTLRGTPASGSVQPADPGAAVYFKLLFHRGGKSFERFIVLTCDKWTRVAWNLYAIAKDIEAQRARQRWGCTNVEQAFRGYTAIPERTGGGAWWEELGVSPNASAEEIKHAYRHKANTEHPDHGGNPERWARLQECYEQAMARFTAE